MPDLHFNTTQHILLLIPILIWGIFLFGGFIFGTLNDEGTNRIPTHSRMASSFALVTFASLWMLLMCDTTYRAIAQWFALGMTLGFIGDLFMAQLLPIKDHVLGGIGSFGLGHIAYITGLLSVGTTLGLTDTGIQFGTWVLWLIIGSVLWYQIVYRDSDQTFLHKAALPYALLLASTAGVAMGLALQNPAFIPITIGAGLFLLSDLILATELFNGANWRYIGDVVWLTYGPGQMLIIAGLALPILF